ncbi:MFS transporter [Actinoplanes sp. NPDC051343]|uniref:MFS transporter n=1 Tax=Actinoplanes sp. NPDC051343 TaxID=3363906 RepID=UPI0037A5B45B
MEIRRAALHVGGLLGPFGGGVAAPMLPQLAQSLHLSLGAAGWAITTYFVPFAVVQLVSGTLGERWGRRRTTRAAFLTYAVAGVLCAVAPGAALFFTGRILQGVANAFTTPLLVAGLAEAAGPVLLSRTLGVFAASQAAGQSLAPLVGALSLPVGWRWAYVLPALVAAALALVPPPGEARPKADAPRFRPLITRRMAVISAAGFATYAAGAGLPFLVSLYAERRLAVSSTVLGLILVGFGVAAILLAPYWGVVSGRIGPPLAAAAGLAGCGVFVALVPWTGSVIALTATWTVAGGLLALATVAVQSLAATEVPGNRGGAVSVVSAFRFAGGAVAPLIWLPLYPRADSSAVPAFTFAGVVALLGAAAALALRRRTAAAVNR